MRYFLIISLILNAGLLMAVLGVVYFFLYLSILVNVGMGWYIYNLLGKVEYVNEDIDNILSSVNGLSEHLDAIYELEMFYGDETLQHLLNHASSFNAQLETFEHIYTLTEEEPNANEIEIETEAT